MSEEIKTQAQKVIDARRNEGTAWNKYAACEPYTAESMQLNANFQKANRATSRAERMLSELVIQECFGEVAY